MSKLKNIKERKNMKIFLLLNVLQFLIINACFCQDLPLKAKEEANKNIEPQVISAFDWPQYKRDASRSGDASEESIVLPLQRVMAIKFPSSIYASVAILGGRIYAVDERGLMACIEQKTNQVNWTAEIGGVSNRSSPAVVNGKVFVGSTAGYLLVLDAQNGKEITRVPAEGGVIAAPAIANNAVYCLTFNGKMLKVDLNGKLVWTYDGGKSANAEFMVQGKNLVFWAGPVDEKGAGEPYGLHVVEDKGDKFERKQLLRRADLEGGKIKFGNNPEGSENGLFQRDNWVPSFGVTRRGSSYLHRDIDVIVWGGPTGHKSPLTGVVSQPVISKDHIIIGDSIGRIQIYTFVPGKNFTGKSIGSFDTSRIGKPNGGVSATAAISSGVIYVGGEDGVLYGLGNGKEVEITDVLPQAKMVKASAERLKGLEWPTVGGDMSYGAVSPDKNLKPPFKIQWKTRIAGSGAQSNVIVANGLVYVSSYNGYIEALDAASGEIIWRTYQEGIRRNNEYGSDGPLTFSDDRLLIIRRNGLWCHDAKTGEFLWKNSKIILPVPGGAPQGDGLVVFEKKVLVAWHEQGDGVEVAALDLETGKEAWHLRHEGVLPHAPAEAKTVFTRVCQGALGEKTWFISICTNFDGGEGRPIGGSALAIDPTNGKLVWKTTEARASGFGGINYRNGIVLFYHTGRGNQALEAATGKLLWSNTGPIGSGIGPWHLAPLTDAFLASKGKSGLIGGYCTDSICVNDYSYGPLGSSSHGLAARKLNGAEVWRYIVLSRGCPAPAPAYGRLYYAGFSEGVVYCFVNQEQ